MYGSLDENKSHVTILWLWFQAGEAMGSVPPSKFRLHLGFRPLGRKPAGGREDSPKSIFLPHGCTRTGFASTENECWLFEQIDIHVRIQMYTSQLTAIPFLSCFWVLPLLHHLCIIIIILKSGTVCGKRLYGVVCSVSQVFHLNQPKPMFFFHYSSIIRKITVIFLVCIKANV